MGQFFKFKCHACKNYPKKYCGQCCLLKFVWYLPPNTTGAFCVWAKVLRNDLKKQQYPPDITPLTPFDSSFSCAPGRSRFPLSDSVFEYKRPFPSSKISHFQNEAMWETFVVKMSVICMRITSHFHINAFALSLALKQRLEPIWKWSINV